MFIIRLVSLGFYIWLFLSFLEFVNYNPKIGERLGECFVSALFNSQRRLVEKAAEIYMMVGEIRIEGRTIKTLYLSLSAFNSTGTTIRHGDN